MTYLRDTGALLRGCGAGTVQMASLSRKAAAPYARYAARHGFPYPRPPCPSAPFLFSRDYRTFHTHIFTPRTPHTTCTASHCTCGSGSPTLHHPARTLPPRVHAYLPRTTCLLRVLPLWLTLVVGVSSRTAHTLACIGTTRHTYAPPAAHHT